MSERFWSKVSTGEPTHCWEWDAGRDQDGYGMFWLDGRTHHASRIAYELTWGPIPDGRLVRHTCDNPPCVNPAHLILGTNLDNMRDAKERGRLATGDRNGSRLYPERLRRGMQPGPCRNGHPEEFRYVSASGESRCTRCGRDKARRHRARANA